MDLFETPELIPDNVSEILDTFNEEADSYKECARLLSAVESIGYTFDYGLDGQPYDLTKIKPIS